MVGKTVQRAKVIFEFYKGHGLHPFRWRARSSNGKIICSGEGMLHKGSPTKTVTNMCEAIMLGQYEMKNVEK